VATKDSFHNFGLTRPGIEPTIYPGEHLTHYIIEESLKHWHEYRVIILFINFLRLTTYFIWNPLYTDNIDIGD